ncbi:MAG: DUF2796 domain-containing protein [Wenzhouxiangella sp.]|nr:DUF2796 domain-containing protein [Wenzhouxiangella sp.]
MTSSDPKTTILCSTGIVHALIGVIVLLAATPVSAQIERQHAAHVHGEATGSLAVDGSTVSVQLALPGHNVVGFEHPPRTDAQQQRFDQAMNALQQGEWLAFNPAAGCATQSMSATPSGFGGDDHDHDHDHGHDHGHDQSHDDDSHAQFELVAVAECARPEALQWAEVQLFDGFPNNEQIVVDVLTAQSVFQARLAPGASRIEWP